MLTIEPVQVDFTFSASPTTVNYKDTVTTTLAVSPWEVDGLSLPWGVDSVKWVPAFGTQNSPCAWSDFVPYTGGSPTRTCRKPFTRSGTLTVFATVNGAKVQESVTITVTPPELQVTANPSTLAGPDSVTFTAAATPSTIIWNLSSWTWRPDSGTGGISSNCVWTQKICTRLVAKSGWMKANATIGEYALADSARVDVGICNATVLTILGEYDSLHVTPKPTCADFTDSGGTTHFSWSELNDGWTQGNPHEPWGMVRAQLTDGLEATRTNYNRGGIRLSSGYRCPHGNAGIPGAAANSLHMQGRAADMYSAEYAWTEEEFNLLKAAADSTSPVQSFTWDQYPDDRHYHAAW